MGGEWEESGRRVGGEWEGEGRGGGRVRKKVKREMKER